jgi:hypothetical protein
MADRLIGWQVTLDALGYDPYPSSHLVAESLLRCAMDQGIIHAHARVHESEDAVDLLGPIRKCKINVTCHRCGITSKLTGAVYDGWYPAHVVAEDGIEHEVIEPVCKSCVDEMVKYRDTPLVREVTR